MKSPLIPLLKSGSTVFSNNDLRLYWRIDGANYLKTKIYRLVKEGLLIRLVNGIYALDTTYNPLELANKLVTPSYVSLRTVLAQAGAVFQYDSAVYSIARTNREFEIDGRRFVYRKIKDSAFLVSEGLLFEKAATIATPERALLDLLYLDKDVSVDNIVIDQGHCMSLLPLYQNKKLTERVKSFFDTYA